MRLDILLIKLEQPCANHAQKASFPVQVGLFHAFNAKVVRTLIQRAAQHVHYVLQAHFLGKPIKFHHNRVNPVQAAHFQMLVLLLVQLVLLVHTALRLHLPKLVQASVYHVPRARFPLLQALHQFWLAPNVQSVLLLPIMVLQVVRSAKMANTPIQQVEFQMHPVPHVSRATFVKMVSFYRVLVAHIR